MKTRNSDRQKQREDLSVTCQENVSMSEYPFPSAQQTPIRRRGPIHKKPKQTMINLKKNKSQRQFICYEDKDLNIPQEYQSILQKHKSDDDRESDDEQIKYAINYLYKDLLLCLEKEKK
ncbi:unnamed protein product [Paramecium octaurelia]|uniref:Uncharacterized protein n=1 Tax=Paramecium octaurelia TaxID=43137 RepID=A0A8S1UGG5_PAROT|nr:unnamed protein product [Paramecium octaurelia]